jgi:hypothetical protein
MYLRNLAKLSGGAAAVSPEPEPQQLERPCIISEDDLNKYNKKGFLDEMKNLFVENALLVYLFDYHGDVNIEINEDNMDDISEKLKNVSKETFINIMKGSIKNISGVNIKKKIIGKYIINYNDFYDTNTKEEKEHILNKVIELISEHNDIEPSYDPVNDTETKSIDISINYSDNTYIELSAIFIKEFNDEIVQRTTIRIEINMDDDKKYYILF